jgi:hypothetical protein
MNLKRGASSFLAVAAIVISSNAAFAGSAPRIEEAAYLGGTPPGLNLTAQLADKGIGGVVLPGGTEKFVSVVASDDSGLPVSIAVTQDTTGDGVPEIRYEACGATEKSVKVQPGKNVVVYVFEGPCGTAPSGVATGGTITATFTKGRA